jgi:hypothetical protein
MSCGVPAAAAEEEEEEGRRGGGEGRRATRSAPHVAGDKLRAARSCTKLKCCFELVTNVASHWSQGPLRVGLDNMRVEGGSDREVLGGLVLHSGYISVLFSILLRTLYEVLYSHVYVATDFR